MQIIEKDLAVIDKLGELLENVNTRVDLQDFTEYVVQYLIQRDYNFSLTMSIRHSRTENGSYPSIGPKISWDDLWEKLKRICILVRCISQKPIFDVNKDFLLSAAIQWLDQCLGPLMVELYLQKNAVDKEIRLMYGYRQDEQYLVGHAQYWQPDNVVSRIMTAEDDGNGLGHDPETGEWSPYPNGSVEDAEWIFQNFISASLPHWINGSPARLTLTTNLITGSTPFSIDELWPKLEVPIWTEVLDIEFIPPYLDTPQSMGLGKDDLEKLLSRLLMNSSDPIFLLKEGSPRKVLSIEKKNIIELAAADFGSRTESVYLFGHILSKLPLARKSEQLAVTISLEDAIREERLLSERKSLLRGFRAYAFNKNLENFKFENVRREQDGVSSVYKFEFGYPLIILKKSSISS